MNCFDHFNEFFIQRSTPQANNKITLWQGFSILGGQIDTIAIYEKDVLKIVMNIPTDHLDKIWLRLGTKNIDFYTSRSRVMREKDVTQCSKEEVKRSIMFPFPIQPLFAVWDEKDSIVTITIPWLKGEEKSLCTKSLLKGSGWSCFFP
ncbi:uncharacterized protein LOC106669525 [Cimex lectularius]|uniref:SHSP domain-containing protein n=1 Tax=Cimex lectularius TaxID=79782 RepID=A0A8I6S223_CIMLE|nr:uncharacterized protein LOC106669525 [Cimex lectularius]